MENTWTKNKWTLICVIVYSIIVLLFGEVRTPMQIGTLITSFIVIPFINNFKINSKSMGYNILAGLVFGFFVTPFSFSSFGGEYTSLLNFKYQSQVFYWFLILFLNLCYVTHRSEYKRRKDKEDLADQRDNKIDELLNPVKNKFFL